MDWVLPQAAHMQDSAGPGRADSALHVRHRIEAEARGL